MMTQLPTTPNQTDPWTHLRHLTPARIALGRAGTSLPTHAQLEFQLAHALARDAVHIPLDFLALSQQFTQHGIKTLQLQTQAENQQLYLQRPDLGKQLTNASIERLRNESRSPHDVVIVIADGLSSSAISHHAAALVTHLIPHLHQQGLHLAPVCLVQHGRVAIGDPIAQQLNATLCIVLIGERPGLSSPDSLGIYFTYQAQAGVSTDADRNCISNIHQHGLSYSDAIKKLLYLLSQATQRKLSGVQLKDETTDEACLTMSQPRALLVH
jgi:ethanolamine ammonia-lyase small subunit